MNTLWKMRGIGLLLVTAMSAMLVMALPARAQGLSWGDYEEIQIGRREAAQAEREFGGVLPFGHPMSQRVRAIGHRFARLSGRRFIPYTFKVLITDQVPHAFSLPGGPIYISRAMINVMSNDAELASILAHEVAHIDRKHSIEHMRKVQRNAALAQALADLAGSGHPDNARAAQVLAMLGFEAWKGRYNRKQENEADRMAVNWMSRLGYDPRAAHSMLVKLVVIEGRGRRRTLWGIGEDHPSPRDRQKKVADLINQGRLLEVARRAGGPRLSSGVRYSLTAYRSIGGYAPVRVDVPQVYVFNAPLLGQRNGQGQIVPMVATTEFARWAGARPGWSRNGRVLALRRGNLMVELPADSNRIYVNGRALTMHGWSRNYGGQAYAPFEALAEVFGVRFKPVIKGNLAALVVDLPGRTIGVIPA